MCGICGEIRFDDTPPSEAALERMASVMLKRGPDSAGKFQKGRVGMAHRRLKIIDLSDASSQPMVDEELKLSIVYNGAIYNYKELRAELEGKGYKFFSRGDTEVLIKAYHAWGLDFVRKLNGMFAFALHDWTTDDVILGRDRLGIKPLYYTRDGKRLRFASALPALLAGGDVDTSINPVALNYYMTFHSVVPPPRTLLNGVRKLPPASLMILKGNGEEQELDYWRLEFEQPEDRRDWSEEQWEEATLDMLRRAVKRRLVADVPVGVLLSGGLDSSLIVGLLCEQGAEHVETFSIGFESVGDEQGDEFQYSDIVAERFDTSHHKLFVDSTKAMPSLMDCIDNMSEPMVSHDNVGFYMLSQEVAKHVKVVQSGQGADEIFGGYHWYPPMLESKDPVADYSRVFFDRDYAEYKRAVNSRFHGHDYASEFIREHFDAPGAQRAVDKALRTDTLVMLVDDPVKRVDNNTMAASLEARVPFLDHELVEFAATIPAELKLAQEGKGILKEAARKVIPHEVIDRPKGYFPVPALKYLRGEFLDMARETVSNDTARQRNLFERDYVDMLLADPEKHITPLRGSKLWQITLLELWLQKHNI